MKNKAKFLLNNFELIFASICVSLSTILVLMNVFLRYFLKTGIYWSEEVCTMSFVWCVFIGSAAAYKNGAHLGVDLVHFGLICIVNIMIGGLTPPFGSMMFTCCSITGCDLMDFLKEVVPFIIALIIALLIVTYCPTVTMFVPNLIYGG